MLLKKLHIYDGTCNPDTVLFNLLQASIRVWMKLLLQSH